MMEANAYLLFTRISDLKGNPEQITVEWEGPKGGTLAISEAFINEANLIKVLPSSSKLTGCYKAISKLSRPDIGDIFQVGPYKLKIFEYEPCREIYYLTRLDSPIGSLRATAYRLTRWLGLIYRRLIITAAVWKLADYHEAQIPSWQDLHIAKHTIGFSKAYLRFVKLYHKLPDWIETKITWYTQGHK